MDKATPRPWRDEHGRTLRGADGKHIATFHCVPTALAGMKGPSPAECEANIEIARRAVNAHDQLVAALEEIADSAGPISEFTDLDVLDVNGPAMTRAREIARAALAKAKGGE